MYLEPLGLSQTVFAAALQISYPRLNEIINGRRRVTPDTALRLATALDTTPELWMNLQQAVDVYEAKLGFTHTDPIPQLVEAAYTEESAFSVVPSSTETVMSIDDLSLDRSSVSIYEPWLVSVPQLVPGSTSYGRDPGRYEEALQGAT